ncbi:MAG TPA: PEP-CTERM sorting domain-containing protein [Terrimicrobiaceae bacterium]
MKNSKAISSFAAALALVVSSASLRAQSYTAFNLGPGNALSINNLGQVVGSSTFEVNGSPSTRATLFSGTGSNNIDLGTLGGLTSSALDINDAGQIVGAATLADGRNHATLFSGTGSNNIDLGTLGGSSSSAYGISNSGQIVGEAQVVGDSVSSATLFSGTGSGNIDLGSPYGGPHSSRAYAINNSGQIVGKEWGSATLFGATGSENTNLPASGTGSDAAYDINDAGAMTGATLSGRGPQSPLQAFIWSKNGPFIGLGTYHPFFGAAGQYMTGEARAINNSGQIVGTSTLISRFGPSDTVPFISSGGGMTDLRTITAGANSLSSPLDINDWGQILAGNFLLNPVNPLTTASGIKFFGGMTYDKFAGLSETGGLATTVKFLGGAAGTGGAYLANRDVNVSFTERGSNAIASDIVNLSGTSGAGFADTIVLQLTYDEATAIALFGSESLVRLGWFDSLTNQWRLAVSGNTGGAPFFAGDGAYDPATGFVLGYYGLDTASNTVWAVLNHNSEFAVVPEPSTYILLAIGMFFLLCKSRRARFNRA